MSSIKVFFLKFFFPLFLFFFLGYFSNQLLFSKYSEQEIYKYLENNPDKINQFIDKAISINDDIEKEKIKELIHENKDELEKSKFYIGNPNGRKIIFEFFDYNCGYCKNIFSDLMDLVSDDNDLKIILVELPVLGESSILASKAAMAANIQNKYFEMHQKLIGNKGKINLDLIKFYAEEISLDVKKLMNDINEIDTKYIEINYNLADKLKINGTPTFLVGDKIIPGAISKSSMKELIISAYN
tara:strand:+ start:118 stop:843 length:726 start_codon:yes stop_codon:yes gene_type:complete